METFENLLYRRELCALVSKWHVGSSSGENPLIGSRMTSDGLYRGGRWVHVCGCVPSHLLTTQEQQKE